MSHDPGLFSPMVKSLARELALELVPLLRDALAPAEPAKPSVVRDDDAAYLSIAETCARFGVSRATFDRMLRTESTGLREVVVRLPPVTGRVKVPLRAFEAWLRGQPQRRRARGKSRPRAETTPSP